MSELLRDWAGADFAERQVGGERSLRDLIAVVVLSAIGLSLSFIAITIMGGLSLCFVAAIG
jgi:hypothetical protein